LPGAADCAAGVRSGWLAMPAVRHRTRLPIPHSARFYCASSAATVCANRLHSVSSMRPCDCYGTIGVTKGVRFACVKGGQVSLPALLWGLSPSPPGNRGVGRTACAGSVATNVPYMAISLYVAKEEWRWGCSAPPPTEPLPSDSFVARVKGTENMSKKAQYPIFFANEFAKRPPIRPPIVPGARATACRCDCRALRRSASIGAPAPSQHSTAPPSFCLLLQVVALPTSLRVR